MKTFNNEAQRYDYPLASDSLVLDVGAYRGLFSEGISHKHSCRVIAFEPIKQYFEIAKARLASLGNVSLLNCGVGPVDAQLPIAVADDWSSLHLLETIKDHETVEIKGIDWVFNSLLAGQQIDLMKINIEGAEYDLLDAMIVKGLMPRIRYLQIQFHSHGGGSTGVEARRAAIREQLSLTHDEQWCTDFVWESWQRRG